MADIFLSYSHEDTSFRDRIVKDLETEGFSVWTDQDIEPGTPSWQETIAEQIELAVCTVVLLSPRSKSSQWVNIEVSYSDTQNKMVLPVLIEGEEKTSIPINLLNRHYVDLRTQYQNNLPKLVNALKKRISHSKTAKKERTLVKPDDTFAWRKRFGNDPTGERFREPIFSSSSSLPEEASARKPTTDRQSVKRAISSILTSFYSKYRLPGDVEFGKVSGVLAQHGISVSVRPSSDLAAAERKIMFDKLSAHAFTTSTIEPSTIYPKLYSDVRVKSWPVPETELEDIADEIIEVNLILGLSLGDIKIESDF